MDQDKVFANDTIDKGLISKVYKQLIPLNDKKKKKKTRMSEDLN